MVYLLPILAVLLSFGFVLLTKPKAEESFKLLLAFSGAFLLALTLFELLPDVYASPDTKTMGVFILLGILLQIFLEFFSRGAEHGHMHFEVRDGIFPWGLFLSLCTHALLEGIPMAENDTIVYGILVHKIPVAIILAIFLLGSGMDTKRTVAFMLLFALMTPIGTWMMDRFSVLNSYSIYGTALVIGVFLHISTVILFESAENHRFNRRKLLVILIGIATAYLL